MLKEKNSTAKDAVLKGVKIKISFSAKYYYFLYYWGLNTVVGVKIPSLFYLIQAVAVSSRCLAMSLRFPGTRTPISQLSGMQRF